jgi:glycosyltransferase involved in cell wall biosynthesis
LQAGPAALRPARLARENGLRVSRSVYLKIPGSEKLNILRWSRKVVRMYRRYQKSEGKPGLILSHSATWAGYAAALIRMKYGIPFLVVEHRSFFVWSTREARSQVRSFHVPFFEKTYRQCSTLVPVSASMMTGLEKLFPWIGEKVTIIPNMIREDMFLLPSSPRSHDPFTFLWAGRLEHVKGLDVLLKAVRQIQERGEGNFILKLAGKGSLRRQLEDLAGELGVADRVFFLGRISREEMQKEMQQACCFVLPSRYEAFGAVLVEAMATGLPVIATRSGGPVFIVTQETGILVDPEDVSGLAGAMIRMMAAPEVYQGDRIRGMAMERYGETRVMEAYNHLFEKIINQNANQP